MRSMDYSDIKMRKNISIAKNSVDSWKLGEMIIALGYDKEKSKFTATQKGFDLRVNDGVVVFNNGAVVQIV